MENHWKLVLRITLICVALSGCTTSTSPMNPGIPSPIATEEIEKVDPTPTDPRPAANEIETTTESARIPLIYAHGGAPCDIGALVYFTKHPDIDLIGMVLSRGEIHPENALDYWSVFLSDVLGHKDIPIALGTDERMDQDSHDFPVEWRNAGDNFWGLALPEQINQIDPHVGHELIIELVNNSPEKVTIIAMASMIDIALALQEDPGIIDNISHVIIMGGAFTVPGNLADAPYEIDNKVAEWNIWIDAKAAWYLFNSGVPLSIVPLDAIQYLVQPDDVNMINSINDPGVGYIAQNWNFQIGINESGFLIWDTITATAVTNPEYFSWTYDGVDVITESGAYQGQTIALHNGATHTRYATTADYQAILDLLFDVYGGEAVTASLNDGESSDTGSTTPSESEAEVVITGLAGTWKGYTGNFHITFYLGSACTLGQICGTFEIPEFSLSGDITIVKIVGDRYEFQATNLSSGQTSTNYDYLQVQEDGTLYYLTSGSGVTNEAVLEKQ